MSVAALALALALSTNAMPTPVLVLDGDRSSAEFEAHVRLPIRGIGRFGQMRGELTGSAAEGWRVSVHIDGRAMRFDGPAWMGNITRSRDFLDVQEYPDIALRTAAITDAVLHRGGPVRGELTLRGRTRPAVFQLLAPGCARPGQDCDLQVQGTVSRRDFGMTGYRLSVRDGVDVRVRLRWRPRATP